MKSESKVRVVRNNREVELSSKELGKKSIFIFWHAICPIINVLYLDILYYLIINWIDNWLGVLVPGDYVLFPTNGGYTVECDAVLVEGSCVVNESMLTGESIPVTKVSIPDENVKFNYDQQRQYILFQGTQVTSS